MMNGLFISPGYLLLELIEDENLFKPQDKENLSALIKKAKVLKAGQGFTNDFGVARDTNCHPEDIIFVSLQYDADEVEIENKKYYIVPFDRVRGIFNGTK